MSGRDTPDNVADGMALVPEGRRLFPEMTVTLPRGYEFGRIWTLWRPARGEVSLQS